MTESVDSRIAGVYVIRCHATGHAYVGATGDLPLRYLDHFRHLRSGSHPNRQLQLLFDAHGEGSFQFAVAETLTIRATGRHNGGLLAEIEERWVGIIRSLVGDMLINKRNRYFDGFVSKEPPKRSGLQMRTKVWPPLPRGGPDRNRK